MIGHFPGTGTSIKSDGVKLVDLKGMFFRNLILDEMFATVFILQKCKRMFTVFKFFFLEKY
jgi:hypothetical protein